MIILANLERARILISVVSLCEILCWPRGIFDENLLNIAKSVGYKAFFTTQRGINRADNNLNFIKRIAVKKDEKWLKKSLFIYRNDILGGIYSWVKKT